MSGETRAVRGVNLGGWLVLEKWITPSLFKGLQATDEYTFCEELGAEAASRLRHHRDSFIMAADFRWLKEQGIEAIRLPVGYWLLGGEEPFVEATHYVDFAFEQATQNGLKVVLDLHAAPGSQNGNDHSGRAGEIDWHKNSDNIKRTLTVIERLAERYGNEANLTGIELLNEPGWEVSFDILRDFYNKGYKIIRKIAGSNVAVIISDGYKPDEWFNAMPASKYENLVMDMHLYQVFTPEDRALSLQGHIDKTLNEWGTLIEKMRQSNPVIIGEWSGEMQYEPEKYIDDHEASREYVKAQLQAFQKSNGWFFWTYKTEDRKYWSLRDCVPDVIDLK
jgi:glucan 1,3-beta-glucosidase